MAKGRESHLIRCNNEIGRKVSDKAGPHEVAHRVDRDAISARPLKVPMVHHAQSQTHEPYLAEWCEKVRESQLQGYVYTHSNAQAPTGHDGSSY
ncbi:hypothetical protein RRF57_009353 [Xylaria bambusicola]|uniref:Uncharacterized protein n=1 Tax=Xylaria bambusicola TaxID=326684 RepID=A0AAN7UTG8_9PEZI